MTSLRPVTTHRTYRSHRPFVRFLRGCGATGVGALGGVAMVLLLLTGIVVGGLWSVTRDRGADRQTAKDRPAQRVDGRHDADPIP